jgi:anhydro-N-acetylmuramic acid kinase
LIVAGVMSGTSADGIDVALVRIESKGSHPELELIAHHQIPYLKKVRRAILDSMNAVVSVAGLSRLNFLLGELYAEAVEAAQGRAKLKCELVGCHGQTIYHQGTAAPFLGGSIACTWQIGEGAVLASRLGVPVVSDFRPADMAAGGKGAPLVPFLDYAFFRDAHLGRIVQNIGGIANLTAIPPDAAPEDVIAFDTGPGNMVIDAVAQNLFNRAYDPDGKFAAKGTPQLEIVSKVLRTPFFRQLPPKTAGREEFGREFVRDFLRLCRGKNKHDVIATATALTALSIEMAIRNLILGLEGDSNILEISQAGRYPEMIVSGGGTKNATLMQMLATDMARLNIRIRTTDEFGLPSEAKEAVAFALLAYETWHRQPSNVPSATGAKRPAILGKISYG